MNDNIAAVHQIDRKLQAKGLYGEIAQSERINLKRAVELGKLLNEIKEDGEHGDLKATGIPRQRAWEFMMLAKCPAPDILACESIRDAMKLLKGMKEVPFETPRESGDMTPAEAELDRIETQAKATAARIQEVLCANCKRKGISCDRCRVKVFNLQNPRDETPAAPTNTPTKPTGNGAPIFLWPRFNKHYGETVRSIDTVCNGYGIPVVNPEAQALRNRLDDWNRDFKKWTAKITKQQAPEV